MSGVFVVTSPPIMTMPDLNETTLVLFTAQLDQGVILESLSYRIDAGGETGYATMKLQVVSTLGSPVWTGSLTFAKTVERDETVQMTGNYLATTEPTTYGDEVATQYLNLAFNPQGAIAPDRNYKLPGNKSLGLTLELPAGATAGNVKVFVRALLEE